MATTNVAMTCLQGLADLERMEGPWLIGSLAQMTWTSKRLLGAMVLDRMDVQLATTRLGADVCHADVDNSPFCQPGCQHSDEGSSATARPNR